MNVLIISDDPERESFRQIEILKRQIENVIKKQADLIAFSFDGIYFNQKIVTKQTGNLLTKLVPIFKGKAYSLFIISLGLKYLTQLFPNKHNVVDLITKTSPKAVIFIYGANNIIKTIKPSNRVFLQSRRGVAKITQEFKNQIITHVQSLK
jgi:hypothetical protein